MNNFVNIYGEEIKSGLTIYYWSIIISSYGNSINIYEDNIDFSMDIKGLGASSHEESVVYSELMLSKELTYLDLEKYLRYA